MTIPRDIFKLTTDPSTNPRAFKDELQRILNSMFGKVSMLQVNNTSQKLQIYNITTNTWVDASVDVDTDYAFRYAFMMGEI